MLGSPISAGWPLCVLHVDDHVLNRRLVEDILVGSGCKAVEASSGQGALDLLDCRLFDVVLMDIDMPGINGIEVVRRLRNTTGPARDTPVIALTSEISRTKADYLALGFNDFIAKPFKISDLMSAIKGCALNVQSLEGGGLLGPFQGPAPPSTLSQPLAISPPSWPGSSRQPSRDDLDAEAVSLACG